MNSIKIAIDGTSGSGKSTIAKVLGERLNIIYINTGVIYRALTDVLMKNLLIDNEIEALNFLKKINIKYINENEIKIDKTTLRGDSFFDNNVTKNVYKIANSKILRPFVNDLLISLSHEYDSLIMEGRDITSFIMAKCKNKFYIDAPTSIRAKRRAKQLNITNPSDINKIENELIVRDMRDKSRELGPLILTSDSNLIDTSKYSIDETIDLIIKKLK